MKGFSGILIGCFLIFSCPVAGQQELDAIMVEKAWIREAPPGMMSLAGYMTARNNSNNDVSLIEVRSEDFAHAMIHKTTHEGDMARMHHQNKVLVPAGQSVHFEPNGYHLMLMHPSRTLKSGDLVPVTLVFSDGYKVNISFEVRTDMPAR